MYVAEDTLGWLMLWKKDFMDGSALPNQLIAISNPELLPKPPALATSFPPPRPNPPLIFLISVSTDQNYLFSLLIIT
jgi:hypothetical protein